MATISQKKLLDSIKILEKEWSCMHDVNVISKSGKEKKIKYKHKKLIGKGSFGIVVQIEDADGVEFALKKTYQDKRYHNRELEMLLMIDHPNIVSLDSYFYTEQTSAGQYLNLITDYSETNLEEYISLKKPVSETLIISIYKQLLEGLNYLHSKNICHRDIKPANILMSFDGKIKICDLGSAKIISTESSNVTYICSRYYRAPENLLGYKGYTTKIDIWAAACVIIEFKTYEPIFKASTSLSTLYKIYEIINVTEEDMLELGVKKSKKITPIGIRKHIVHYFSNTKLLDVLEKSLIFSPFKRPSAKTLLREKIFL